MLYTIRLLIDDAHLMPTTNAGDVIKEDVHNTRYSEYSTYSKPVFDAWCKALKLANCPFTIESDSARPGSPNG